MELGKVTLEGRKFSSPEEEIAFLRQEINKRETMQGRVAEMPKEETITAVVKDYAKTPIEEVIHSKTQIKPQETGAIVLELAPEQHDHQIEGLIGIMHNKGLRNAISVVEGMNSPHLEDDFHRFIVQYLKAGYVAKDLKESSELWKPTHMTLFEITLPEVPKEDANQELKKFISQMEQFYAGMLAGAGEEDYFTLEIANENNKDEFVFFASVPDSKRDLFEKQVYSMFAGVKVREEKNDYNIFNPEGVSVGAVAVHPRNSIFPLKTYEAFDTDPLAVIMNSFSKIDRDGEGAAVQFVIRPAPSEYIKKWKQALHDLEKGVPTSTATDVAFSFGGKLVKGISNFISPAPKHHYNKDKEKKD